MVWYVTLWTNNFEKAAKFYDELFKEIWAWRIMESDKFVFWAKKPWDLGGLSIIKPYNEKPATVWNGVMVAIGLDSNEEVDKMYNKAIELWAISEGEAWPRGSGFYTWYFRDLDWNKLNFFHHKPM